MSESARDLFGVLDGLENKNWVIRRTDVEIDGIAVAIARDPLGRAAILVPALGVAAGTRFESRGLAARVRALGTDGDLTDWLMVVCLSRQLELTFFVFCDDVLLQLESAPAGGDPVTATLEVVERWQALMSELGSSLLPIEKYIGLLAELHVMEHLIAETDSRAAFESWAGPDGARIDFRFAQCGVEVKATAGRDRFKVTIHGLLQLDDTEVGDLRLFAQQFEQVPTGGDSVPDAVARIEALGVSQSELRNAMSRMGYLPVDEAAYKQMRFKVLDERGVRVTAATPRIVAGSFASAGTAEAVSAVTYVLDLTDLTEDEGRVADAGSVLKGVAG